MIKIWSVKHLQGRNIDGFYGCIRQKERKKENKKARGIEMHDHFGRCYVNTIGLFSADLSKTVPINPFYQTLSFL